MMRRSKSFGMRQANTDLPSGTQNTDSGLWHTSGHPEDSPEIAANSPIRSSRSRNPANPQILSQSTTSAFDRYHRQRQRLRRHQGNVTFDDPFSYTGIPQKPPELRQHYLQRSESIAYPYAPADAYTHQTILPTSSLVHSLVMTSSTAGSRQSLSTFTGLPVYPSGTYDAENRRQSSSSDDSDLYIKVRTPCQSNQQLESIPGDKISRTDLSNWAMPTDYRLVSNKETSEKAETKSGGNVINRRTEARSADRSSAFPPSNGVRYSSSSFRPGLVALGAHRSLDFGIIDQPPTVEDSVEKDPIDPVQPRDETFVGRHRTVSASKSSLLIPVPTNKRYNPLVKQSSLQQGDNRTLIQISEVEADIVCKDPSGNSTKDSMNSLSADVHLNGTTMSADYQRHYPRDNQYDNNLQYQQLHQQHLRREHEQRRIHQQQQHQFNVLHIQRLPDKEKIQQPRLRQQQHQKTQQQGQQQTIPQEKAHNQEQQQTLQRQEQHEQNQSMNKQDRAILHGKQIQDENPRSFQQIKQFHEQHQDALYEKQMPQNQQSLQNNSMRPEQHQQPLHQKQNLDEQLAQTLIQNEHLQPPVKFKQHENIQHQDSLEQFQPTNSENIQNAQLTQAQEASKIGNMKYAPLTGLHDQLSGSADRKLSLKTRSGSSDVSHADASIISSLSAIETIENALKTLPPENLTTVRNISLEVKELQPEHSEIFSEQYTKSQEVFHKKEDSVRLPNITGSSRNKHWKSNNHPDKYEGLTDVIDNEVRQMKALKNQQINTSETSLGESKHARNLTTGAETKKPSKLEEIWYKSAMPEDWFSAQHTIPMNSKGCNTELTSINIRDNGKHEVCNDVANSNSAAPTYTNKTNDNIYIDCEVRNNRSGDQDRTVTQEDYNIDRLINTIISNETEETKPNSKSSKAKNDLTKPNEYNPAKLENLITKVSPMSPKFDRKPTSCFNPLASLLRPSDISPYLPTKMKKPIQSEDPLWHISPSNSAYILPSGTLSPSSTDVLYSSEDQTSVSSARHTMPLSVYQKPTSSFHQKESPSGHHSTPFRVGKIKEKLTSLKRLLKPNDLRVSRAGSRSVPNIAPPPSTPVTLSTRNYFMRNLNKKRQCIDQFHEIIPKVETDWDRGVRHTLSDDSIFPRKQHNKTTMEDNRVDKSEKIMNDDPRLSDFSGTKPEQPPNFNQYSANRDGQEISPVHDDYDIKIKHEDNISNSNRNSQGVSKGQPIQRTPKQRLSSVPLRYRPKGTCQSPDSSRQNRYHEPVRHSTAHASLPHKRSLHSQLNVDRELQLRQVVDKTVKPQQDNCVVESTNPYRDVGLNNDNQCSCINIPTEDYESLEPANTTTQSSGIIQNTLNNRGVRQSVSPHSPHRLYRRPSARQHRFEKSFSVEASARQSKIHRSYSPKDKRLTRQISYSPCECCEQSRDSNTAECHHSKSATDGSQSELNNSMYGVNRSASDYRVVSWKNDVQGRGSSDRQYYPKAPPDPETIQKHSNESISQQNSGSPCEPDVPAESDTANVARKAPLSRRHFRQLSVPQPSSQNRESNLFASGRGATNKTTPDYESLSLLHINTLAFVAENLSDPTEACRLSVSEDDWRSLTWSNINITAESPILVTEYAAFYAAVINAKDNTVTTGDRHQTITVPQCSAVNFQNNVVFPPVLADFTERIPSRYLRLTYFEDDSDSGEQDDDERLICRVRVLPRCEIATLEGWADNASTGSRRQFDSAVCSILLQLVAALKTLQSLGVEDTPADLESFLLFTSPGARTPRLCIMLDALTSVAGGSGDNIVTAKQQCVAPFLVYSMSSSSLTRRRTLSVCQTGMVAMSILFRTDLSHSEVLNSVKNIELLTNPDYWTENEPDTKYRNGTSLITATTSDSVETVYNSGTLERTTWLSIGLSCIASLLGTERCDALTQTQRVLEFLQWLLLTTSSELGNDLLDSCAQTELPSVSRSDSVHDEQEVDAKLKYKPVDRANNTQRREIQQQKRKVKDKQIENQQANAELLEPTELKEIRDRIGKWLIAERGKKVNHFIRQFMTPAGSKPQNKMSRVPDYTWEQQHIGFLLSANSERLMVTALMVVGFAKRNNFAPPATKAPSTVITRL